FYGALALILGALAGFLGGRFGAVGPAVAYGTTRRA
ncbi:PhnA-like protein, partial [Methylobacterium sp. WL103]